MSSPSVRRGLLGQTCSIVAPARANRPQPALGPAANRDAHCPLCEGNESETAREVFALRPSGTAADTPGWSVRVVPNKYPALRARMPVPIEARSPFEAVPAVGFHEVVVDTPTHDLRMAEFSVELLETVLTVYQARVQALASFPGVKSIALFRNDGRAAGASQTHPHSQILALPMVPTSLLGELEAVERHFRTKGCCVTCEMLEYERESAQRLIAQNLHFAAVTSYAARYAYETWIVPRAHNHDFRLCDPGQMRSLAGILRQTLRALESVVGSFPFNLVLQTVPVDQSLAAAEGFHWRLEILPRPTVPSGLELGCNVFIVSVSPEEAACRLRSAAAAERDPIAGAEPGA